MTGVTLRGAIRLKSGITEFGYSTDDDGNGVISWESVPPGAWAYDVFMDRNGDESPLLRGCFVSAGRVTPDLPGEKQAIAGAVIVNLPDGNGCVNVLLGGDSSAAYYAEQAKEASNEAQQSKEDSQKAAENAGQSAESAEDAAKRAEDVLAAMPEIDAEGNMTLQGNLAAKGAVFTELVTCGKGLSLPGGERITLSNGGATIFANENNATIRVPSLASAGEISGNAVNCNRVAASTLSISTAATFGGTINANGGVNIPVAPSMDTQAARFREVQLLQEMEFSPLRTYFKSPDPVPFGVLLDRFWWAANRDNMPAWTVATAEFSHISPDYFNFDYDSLTSCYFPMSCGLGFGRCFDSIAIGNVAFNADYASLDGDPFVTPADYMRYWVDVQIGRPANAQCSVFVRMFWWDRGSNSLVNTEYRSSVPDSLALRGVALSMTSEFSGVWLVGFDKKVGRLVSYKVLPETFEGSSYRGVLSNNRLSLAKTGWHAAMGVHAPRYYGGTVVGEWCSLIQAS